MIGEQIDLVALIGIFEQDAAGIAVHAGIAVELDDPLHHRFGQQQRVHRIYLREVDVIGGAIEQVGDAAFSGPAEAVRPIVDDRG